MNGQYALISVWDKTDVEAIAKFFLIKGFTILSTGGTFERIRGLSDKIIQVSDFTGFPEVLDGRVKTLHPKIYSGILARRDQMQELENLQIPEISAVIVNLYPFQETVARSQAESGEILENIDIGGHTLIRAAAKNYSSTLVVVDPNDYDEIINHSENVDLQTYAAKAYSYVAEYDIAIARYFGDYSVRKYTPILDLKYGCNPHQRFGAVCSINNSAPFQVLNGNVGYINVIDALLGLQLVRELQDVLKLPAAASYKHTSPAGVALGIPLTCDEEIAFDVPGCISPVAAAFVRARNCDPLSSFGDFLAISDTVDATAADLIQREVCDGIIAPGYTPEALAVLSKKKKGAFVILQANRYQNNSLVEYREIFGIALRQEPNRQTTTPADLQNIVTTNTALPEQDLILANTVIKYTQSNSVAIAVRGQAIGIGAGQQNRVDCVRSAVKKARIWNARLSKEGLQKLAELKQQGLKRQERINAIYQHFETQAYTGRELALASDAFFPFPDSITVAAEGGVRYVIQPGGSIADEKVIEEANKHGMTMCFTKKRFFLH